MSTRIMQSPATGPNQTRSSRLRNLTRIWAGPAVLVAVGSGGLLGAFQLGIGNGSQPGAGMWPAIISAVIIVSGLVMGPQRDTESIEPGEARKVFSALVLLGAFIVMFSLTGIFFPTLVILTLWLKFLARRKWMPSLIIAASTAAVFYLVFTQFFGVGS